MSCMKYTEEMREFIKKNYKGISSQELADRFNAEFQTSVSASQMAAYRKNHHLISGLTGYFSKGHVPANKGKKMSAEQYEKCKATMFKKGRIPENYKPVGTESERWFNHEHTRKCIWVKIAEPDVWREKHDLVWEEHNGPIPEGHVIIFLDGNTMNPEIENLALVDLRTNLILNQSGLRFDYKEGTEAGILIAEIIGKANDRKKREKK